MRSLSASVSAAPPLKADLNPAPAPEPEPVIRRIWPSAIIAVGLGLTVAWTCLLAYGLFSLLKFTL